MLIAGRIGCKIDVSKGCTGLAVIHRVWLHSTICLDRAKAAIDSRFRVGRKRGQVRSRRGNLLFKVVTWIVDVQRIRVKSIVALYRTVVFVSVCLGEKIRPENEEALTE
jgi:hypothetical protein